MSDLIDDVDRLAIQEGVVDAAAPADPAEPLDPAPGERSLAVRMGWFAMGLDAPLETPKDLRPAQVNLFYAQLR